MLLFQPIFKRERWSQKQTMMFKQQLYCVMSDLFIRYQHQRDAAEKEKRGPNASWKWPFQKSTHPANSHTNRLGQANLFESTSMIEHRIFHQQTGIRDNGEGTSPQEIQARFNAGTVNISAAPTTVVVTAPAAF